MFVAEQTDRHGPIYLPELLKTTFDCCFLTKSSHDHIMSKLVNIKVTGYIKDTRRKEMNI